MTSTHWNVLVVYFIFTLIATLLALARRWLRPNAGGENVWRKYPVYIFINLCFLIAGWLSPEWRVLTLLLALLGALVSWEIARALPHTLLTFFFPVITFGLIVLADFFERSIWFNIWLTIFLFAIAAGTLAVKPVDYPSYVLTLTGCVIYLPLCFAVLLLIHQGDPSGFQVIFLYLVVATNDALAQITGQLFGGRQLSPHISPAKTIEGAIGGVLFASAMGISLSHATGWDYLIGGIFGLILGLAGLVGDLTASLWKRTLGIKNYSTLLGAQGGVLDRFDGLIFAAPVFYLLLIIVF